MNEWASLGSKIPWWLTDCILGIGRSSIAYSVSLVGDIHFVDDVQKRFDPVKDHERVQAYDIPSYIDKVRQSLNKMDKLHKAVDAWKHAEFESKKNELLKSHTEYHEAVEELQDYNGALLQYLQTRATKDKLNKKAIARKERYKDSTSLCATR